MSLLGLKDEGVANNSDGVARKTLIVIENGGKL